ncbi:hypothetical protein F4Z99_02230 [Candidatus Poribacteria bacterium]|nr:hypothetical protein [Candidatus Poribacteria bacterium]MYA98175.1 hypothetical protein [Candidatus Poribacteria bacterium]
MLKRFRVVLRLLLILGFSATLLGKERTVSYFPHALGSYWVYEDQDGNKLTRRAVGEKMIEGETYHAFSYEPAVEEWADYEHYIHPNFYQIRSDGVVFFIGDEVEKAFEAKLRKEMEADSKKQQGISTTGDISADVSYEIEVEAKDDFYFLPTPIVFDKAWTAMQISGSITLKLEIQSTIPNLQVPGGDQKPIPIALVEKGKVVAKETVKTPAGTFEDCLKIEYWYAAMEKEDATQPTSSGTSDIELTRLWLAPNVGIVKFIRVSADSKVEKSLELTQYAIKPTARTDK